MKDFLGREVVAGNEVVYPVRQRSKMWLRRLKVTSTGNGKLQGYSPEGRLLTLQNVSNIVVVTPPEVIA